MVKKWYITLIYWYGENKQKLYFLYCFTCRKKMSNSNFALQNKLFSSNAVLRQKREKIIINILFIFFLLFKEQQKPGKRIPLSSTPAASLPVHIQNESKHSTELKQYLCALFHTNIAQEMKYYFHTLTYW